MDGVNHRGNGGGRFRSQPLLTNPTLERRQDWSLALALFVLALVPRVLDLAAFLTIDEPAWIARSARFAQALLCGDWAGAYQTNHPGVITMWTGSLGLLLHHAVHPAGASLSDFLAWAAESNPTVELLPFVRFPTGVLAALSVAATYLLARRIFGRPMALLGAIFMALDPFFIAHSRVLHHDALGGLFVSVAVLALIVYLAAEPSVRYLALSGAMAGLAALSKSSSLFLGPFVTLAFGLVVLATVWREPARWRTAVLDAVRGGAIWAAAMAATFFVAWPAMWARPLDVLRRMLIGTAGLAEAGHNQFFRGQVVTDPGPWFYPTIAWFRTTPFTLIGLALAAGAVLASWVGVALAVRADLAVLDRGRRQRLALTLALLFVVGFAAFITLSPKKQDRYLLPVFPILDLAAGVGWFGLLRLILLALRRRIHAEHLVVATGLLIGAGLLGSLWIVAGYHPYALSFYNPLAGGSARARQELLIGWGEGMDQVGGYLNRKNAPELLTVAAVPARTLAPYFRGTVTSYLTHTTPALATDYIVEYVDSMQRQGPDVALWQYLRRLKPEAVFRLHGLEYAWLYPGPRALTAVAPAFGMKVDGDFGGRLRLLGYDARPASGALRLGLFWQALAPMDEDYAVSVRLLDEAGHRWAQQDGGLVNGLLPTHDFPLDLTAGEERMLPLPPGMPAGVYRLEVYVYSATTRQDLSPVSGLIAGLASIPKQPAAPDQLAPQARLDWPAGDGLRLLGVDLPADAVQPGATLSPVLYWAATTPVSRTVHVRLTAPDGHCVVEVERPVVLPAGEALLDWPALPMPPDSPSGRYTLAVTLEVAGAGLPLGDVRVEGRARRFDVAANIQRPGRASFDGKIAWLGYDLDASGLRGVAGRLLRLTLYWQAVAPMTDSLKTFVHVLSPGDRIAGQRDGVPGAGRAPTTAWAPGEVLSDTLDIALTLDAPGGPYRLAVGWYSEATGERLPVADEAGRALGNRLLIEPPELKGN